MIKSEEGGSLEPLDEGEGTVERPPIPRPLWLACRSLLAGSAGPGKLLHCLLRGLAPYITALVALSKTVKLQKAPMLRALSLTPGYVFLPGAGC